MLVHRITLDLETTQEIILVVAALVEHILVPENMLDSSQMGTWVSLLSPETLVDLETTQEIILVAALVEHILVLGIMPYSSQMGTWVSLLSPETLVDLETILVTTQVQETFQALTLVQEHILVTI